MYQSNSVLWVPFFDVTLKVWHHQKYQVIYFSYSMALSLEADAPDWRPYSICMMHMEYGRGRQSGASASKLNIGPTQHKKVQDIKYP